MFEYLISLAIMICTHHCHIIRVGDFCFCLMICRLTFYKWKSIKYGIKGFTHGNGLRIKIQKSAKILRVELLKNKHTHNHESP